jgi:DNA topoisomerase-3
VGLGTQSTRAQIIETLLDRKYIERSSKDKKLMALPKGKNLVLFLRSHPKTSVLASTAETARWELKLNLIAESNDNASCNTLATEFLAHVSTFVRESIQELRK